MLATYHLVMQIIQRILDTDGDEWRERMPDPSKQWYALTRLGTADGQLCFDAQTGWTGFSDKRPFREQRAPRFVNPDKWRSLMLEIHELPITVSDTTSLLAWMVLGGEGLVESAIAQKHFAERLAPDECGRIAGKAGWISTKKMLASALQHAPSPKTRAKVILRDNRRCRMCGRTPEEDPHAFLEAHHGVPWGDRQSGLTVEENLFTVCTTCHKGFSGGLERQFLHSIGVNEYADAERERERYFDGVGHYRRLMSASLRKLAG